MPLRHNKRDRHTGRTPSDNRSRYGNDAATKQGTPRNDGHHQKLGRGREGFYVEAQREYDPADNLIVLASITVKE